MEADIPLTLRTLSEGNISTPTLKNYVSSNTHRISLPIIPSADTNNTTGTFTSSLSLGDCLLTFETLQGPHDPEFHTGQLNRITNVESYEVDGNIHWRTMMIFSICSCHCISCGERRTKINLAMEKFKEVSAKRDLSDLTPLDFVRGIRLFNYINENESKSEGLNVIKKLSSAYQLPTRSQLKPSEVLRYFTHAHAIYGKLLNLGQNTGSVVKGITDQRIVCLSTGLKTKNFIRSKFISMALFPAYYLALDHKYNEIILCIRGSVTMADVLTDVAATNEIIRDVHGNDIGHTHGGILCSAINIYNDCITDLIDVKKKYSSYKLIITGHSLGAGAATILSFFLKNRDILKIRTTDGPMICYAFAPPPTLSLENSQFCKAFVNTIVNRWDVVPRLSPVTLNHLFEAFRYAKHGLKWYQKIPFDLGIDFVINKEKVKQRICTGVLDESEMLYLAGDISEIFRHDSLVTGYLEKKYSLVSRSAEYFQEIKWKDGLYLLHTPQSYRKHLKNVVRCSQEEGNINDTEEYEQNYEEPTSNDNGNDDDEELNPSFEFSLS